MDVTLVLADFAEAINGKLYIMGGGWSVLYAAGQPASAALAAVVSVPWDQTNRRHRVGVELLTLDGEAAEANGQPISLAGEFEVGRPPGIKPGSSLNVPLVWNFQGVMLDPGSYEWKMTINDEVVASRPFVVTTPPGAPIPPQ